MPVGILRSIVPFGVLIINCIFFEVFRGFVGRPQNPNFIQWILLEFVATLELCVDCAELDVIFDLHGAVYYGVTLFILCFIWSQMWFKAAASPCDPIEDLILRNDNLKTIVARIIGQLLTVAVAHRYASTIWSYKLIPEHRRYHDTQCESPLQVSMYWGFFIEGAITLSSRFVQLEASGLTSFKEGVINSFMTSMLVLAAMETTGGFFNPALASALKLNCEGSTFWEFFTVYWLGAITGSLVARAMHLVLHKKPSLHHFTVRRASTPGNRNNNRNHKRKCSQ